jgi:uncharacterized membrane protein
MEEVLLILFSLVGLAISFHIWRKAIHQKKKLVCMIGDGGCDEVVKSEYGKMFGIDNTILGMMYYSFIFVASIILLLYPALNNINYLLLGKLIISGGAALFGTYLALVQTLVLKKWCEYCLASSAVSIAIFLAILF